MSSSWPKHIVWHHLYIRRGKQFLDKISDHEAIPKKNRTGEKPEKKVKKEKKAKGKAK